MANVILFGIHLIWIHNPYKFCLSYTVCRIKLYLVCLTVYLSSILSWCLFSKSSPSLLVEMSKIKKVNIGWTHSSFKQNQNTSNSWIIIFVLYCRVSAELSRPEPEPLLRTEYTQQRGKREHHQVVHTREVVHVERSFPVQSRLCGWYLIYCLIWIRESLIYPL